LFFFPAMRAIHLYLFGYFALLVGAGVTLSRSGLLPHISPASAVIAAVVAVVLGLLLLLTSSQRSAPHH